MMQDHSDRGVVSRMGPPGTYSVDDIVLGDSRYCSFKETCRP